MTDDIEIGINYEYINPIINIVLEDKEELYSEPEEIKLHNDSISQIIHIIKNMYQYILQKYHTLFYMKNKQI